MNDTLSEERAGKHREMRDKWKKMSPEERRKAMHDHWEKMSPEERDQFNRDIDKQDKK